MPPTRRGKPAIRPSVPDLSVQTMVVIAAEGGINATAAGLSAQDTMGQQMRPKSRFAPLFRYVSTQPAALKGSQRTAVGWWVADGGWLVNQRRGDTQFGHQRTAVFVLRQGAFPQSEGAAPLTGVTVPEPTLKTLTTQIASCKGQQLKRSRCLGAGVGLHWSTHSHF